MGTPHNEAKNGDIAKTVLMPGDPLRAQFIAENFLENPVRFNTVRNMFGYTGTYKGKRVSVMGSGMGIPSIGLYAHELFETYGVESIIRIGSAGAYTEELKVYDTILVNKSFSESTYARCMCGDDSEFQYPDEELCNKLEKAASDLGIKVVKGAAWSSDVFYYDDAMLPGALETARKNHLLVAEMESFGLFATAKHMGKKAACLLTVSDNIVQHVETTSEERRSKLVDMMKIALEAAE